MDKKVDPYHFTFTPMNRFWNRSLVHSVAILLTGVCMTSAYGQMKIIDDGGALDVLEDAEKASDWPGPWEIVDRPGRNRLDAYIAGDKPFSSESGSYLTMEYEHLEGKVSSTCGIRRMFTEGSPPSGIDTTKPYEIRFQFRLEDVGQGLGFDGSISFTGGYIVEGNRQSTEENGWRLIYNSGFGWQARMTDGNDEKQRFSIGPSDLILQPGEVWDVVISIDPAAMVYHVALESSGGAALNSEDSQTVSYPLAKTSFPPTTISFLMNRKGVGKQATWSIDNVQVRQSE